MSRVSWRPYFLYVLWSAAARRFYIGIAENPERRCQQHNQTARGWTARYRPWELVHLERCADYSAARRRELLLKRQKGGKGFWARTGLDPSCFAAEGS